jgi:hypothetical protein
MDGVATVPIEDDISDLALCRTLEKPSVVDTRAWRDMSRDALRV